MSWISAKSLHLDASDLPSRYIVTSTRSFSSRAFESALIEVGSRVRGCFSQPGLAKDVNATPSKVLRYLASQRECGCFVCTSILPRCRNVYLNVNPRLSEGSGLNLIFICLDKIPYAKNSVIK